MAEGQAEAHPGAPAGRRRPVGVWMLVVVLAGVVWRLVRYGLGFPLWGDEAAVATSFFTRDFGQLLGALEYAQAAPYGFMVPTLAVAEAIGRSEWALRLLPAAAGVAALLVFWRLARKLVHQHEALVAVAIFAASYYPVRHATEVKHFSFDLLIALLIYWLAWRIWQAPDRLRPWAGLAGLSAASLWFSYTAVFVAGGVYMVLLWRALEGRRRAAVLACLGGGLCLVVSFAVMYFVVAGAQMRSLSADVLMVNQWTGSVPPLSEPWRLPLWLLERHTGRMFAYPNGGNNFGSALTTILVLVGGIALWPRKTKGLVILLFSSLPLMFVAAAFQQYPYGGSARTNLHLAGPICLLAGVGIVALLARWLPARRAVVGVRWAVCVMLIIIAGGIVRDVAKPYKTGLDRDIRTMARWLRKASGPNDRWIVYGIPASRFAKSYSKVSFGAERIQYNLYARANVPLLWDPDPTSLRPNAKGRDWLVVYRWPVKHPLIPKFSEQRWDAYRATVVAALGRPRVHRFSFENGIASVEILEFGARR